MEELVGGAVEVDAEGEDVDVELEDGVDEVTGKDGNVSETGVDATLQNCCAMFSDSDT